MANLKVVLDAPLIERAILTGHPRLVAALIKRGGFAYGFEDVEIDALMINGGELCEGGSPVKTVEDQRCETSTGREKMKNG
jgi:hypothetical protein